MSKALTYYGIWCWPEARWLTGWDFVRDKKSPVADAIQIYLTHDAASDAAELLPSALHKLVLIMPIDLVERSDNPEEQPDD